MNSKTLLLVTALLTLSGCVVTPRIELVERFDFNYAPPDQKPLSYADVLCCTDCTA